jgi:MinD-like ATPase involved in chromosome partitioning or flagellar assembly
MIARLPQLAAPQTGFDAPGGPLVAVCGVCPGAGASTVAALVAAAAARASSAPVLACDAGGADGGLAACLGAASPRSLAEVSDELAAGRALDGGLYVTAAPGLRVIATGPRPAEGDRGQLERLLADARDAHRLTVVDCGMRTRAGELIAVRRATHVLWVVPASAAGVRDGHDMLDGLEAPAAREIVVARRDDGAVRRAGVRELTGLAAGRAAPLVLMPAVPARLDRAVAAAPLTLQAILAIVCRA